MSAVKYFLISGVVLFTGVGLIGYLKRAPQKNIESASSIAALGKEGNIQVIQEVAFPKESRILKNPTLQMPPASSDSTLGIAQVVEPSQEGSASERLQLPEADRVHLLFVTDSSKLPIVETVSYTSRVPWVQGRPAWIADYASYYNTSRHFIARSLNKKPDYFSQKISLGDRFNVFKKDTNLQFYLLVDLSRCRLWFYYIDMDKNERVLLKSYPIGVGRADPKSPSGSLTPIGKYTLGNKVAIYKKGALGYFQDTQVEMVRVFGSRWIPFEREIEGCSEGAKGFGLQGVPWIENSETHELVEDRSKIGIFDSDGCIRLCSEDMEELFAIIITKLTTIEIVKHFTDAKPPGVEKEL